MRPFNAGCAVLIGRRKPHYINTLKFPLGYITLNQMTTLPYYSFPNTPSLQTPEKPSKGHLGSDKDTDIRSGESPSLIQRIDAQTLFQNFDSWVRVETTDPDYETKEVCRQLSYSDSCLDFVSPKTSAQKRNQEAHKVVIRPFSLSPMKVEEEVQQPSYEQMAFEKVLIGNGWCRCVNSDEDSD